MTRRFFGTDGIRGRVGEHPMTPEFVLKLAWAAGKVLTREGHSLVLIGKDTRISGYMLESAMEAGLVAAGADIRLLGPLPTPAIAYLTQTYRAAAGVVISASHNPHYDNGVKFFSATGEKLPDSVESEIEELLREPMQTVASEKLGKAERIADAGGRYIEFCKSTIDKGVSLHGLNLIVDCAHGATYQVAPRVFRELGAQVKTIGCEPDGLNINDAVGATAPQALVDRVLKEQADLGIALDGDGDRLILVDKHGDIVDGDEILGILALFAHEQGLLKGGVVGTQMTNLGLELALKEQGIPFVRSRVGDRYVMEQLLEHDWVMGGEGSGHIICRNKIPTGDGIVAAIQVLNVIVQKGLPLHELKQAMQKLPQVLINVPADRALMSNPAVQKAVVAMEAELKDSGRVLLRASGTEPLIRVMVEGQDPQQVQRCAQTIADAVRQASA